MEPDEEQIRRLMEDWRQRTEEGDLEGVLILMTDDGVFLTCGNPPMASFKDLLAENENLKFDDPSRHPRRGNRRNRIRNLCRRLVIAFHQGVRIAHSESLADCCGHLWAPHNGWPNRL
jgi:hypothetical protein